MQNSALEQWLRFAPKPWPLSSGQKWHTYLSYPSAHRAWVLQLYDILVGLGYRVWVDRHGLTPGGELELSVERAIKESDSAVLVWSAEAATSSWIAREYEYFLQRSVRHILVRLDQSSLPPWGWKDVFIDFSGFREGPTGTPLLQLLYGLHGQPLPAGALELAAGVDAETNESLAWIRSARSVGEVGRLRELALRDSLAWKTSANLPCQVIEALIALRAYPDALEIAKRCRDEFPGALRPKQLHALAFARSGNWHDAQLILTELYESGQRDAETLGILARTWMDRYQAEGNPLFLGRSRNLYAEAFRTAPDDSYAGINAAAKSAMLGELDAAAAYAKQVEELVGDAPTPGDYWKTATSAEVKLLQKEYGGAAALYRVAVEQDPLATGSHESSYQQAVLLLDHLGASPEQRGLVLGAFAHLTRAQAAADGPSFQPRPEDRALAARVVFGLVARRFAEPDLMNSLDSGKFWEAVRKARPGATRTELAALAEQLGGHAGGNPSKLWLAWLETSRSRELDKLLV